MYLHIPNQLEGFMAQNGRAKSSSGSIQITLRKNNNTYDFLISAALKIDLDSKTPNELYKV